MPLLSDSHRNRFIGHDAVRVADARRRAAGGTKMPQPDLDKTVENLSAAVTRAVAQRDEAVRLLRRATSADYGSARGWALVAEALNVLEARPSPAPDPATLEDMPR